MPVETVLAVGNESTAGQAAPPPNPPIAKAAAAGWVVEQRPVQCFREIAVQVDVHCGEWLPRFARFLLVQRTYTPKKYTKRL
jgi:hypothetical protein